MIFLVILAFISMFIVFYALWGRDLLKNTALGSRFLSWIEPFEIVLYKKSQTILVARTLSVLGALLTLLTQTKELDITPLMPFVPEKWQGIVQFAWNLLPMTVTGLGMIVEKLRNGTTLPIQVVAVSDKVMAENPVVADAVAKAQDAKVEAVAVVAEQKAAA